MALAAAPAHIPLFIPTFPSSVDDLIKAYLAPGPQRVVPELEQPCLRGPWHVYAAVSTAHKVAFSPQPQAAITFLGFLPFLGADSNQMNMRCQAVAGARGCWQVSGCGRAAGLVESLGQLAPPEEFPGQQLSLECEVCGIDIDYADRGAFLTVRHRSTWLQVPSRTGPMPF